MSDLHESSPQAATQVVALVFSADDDIVGHRRARALAGGLTRAGVQAQVVNKLSNRLDELLLVAKYRVVEVPFTVLVQGEAVIGRLQGAPSTREVLALLDRYSRLG